MIRGFFIGLTAQGIVQRDVFDDDIHDDLAQGFYHFTASFPNADAASFLSSIRFDGEAGARQAAERIAFLLGQMPRFCREGPLEIQLYAEFASWGANKDEMFLELEDIDEEAAAGTLEETMLVYYALEMHPDRVTDDMRTRIENAIPHRLDFLRAALPKADLTGGVRITSYFQVNCAAGNARRGKGLPAVVPKIFAGHFNFNAVPFGIFDAGHGHFKVDG